MFRRKSKWPIRKFSVNCRTADWSTNPLTGQSADQMRHDPNTWPPINVTFDEFNILSNVTSQSATYQFGASCPISKNKLCLSREKTTLNFNPPIQWEELNFKKIRKISKKKIWRLKQFRIKGLRFICNKTDQWAFSLVNDMGYASPGKPEVCEPEILRWDLKNKMHWLFTNKIVIGFDGITPTLEPAKSPLSNPKYTYP